MERTFETGFILGFIAASTMFVLALEIMKLIAK